jgi:ABC-type uncharacterized transport system auxiliary subunit
MARLSAGLALILLLAACAAPPAPRETFFRLEAAAPAERFPRPPLPGVLEVGRVETEGVLADRAIAYQAAAGALQRYHYELWADPPGQMLQETFVRTLRDAGAAGTVVTPDLRVPPDWIMRTRVRRFEQVPAAHEVAVAMQVAILGARDSGVALLKDYAAQAPTENDRPDAVAAAMSQAMARILAELVADVGRISRPGR